MNDTNLRKTEVQYFSREGFTNQDYFGFDLPDAAPF